MRAGAYLAVGDRRGRALWDVATGRQFGTPLPGEPYSTAVPMFTPDGTHPIAAQANGRAYRWDIRAR